jgi:hypothetical protein
MALKNNGIKILQKFCVQLRYILINVQGQRQEGTRGLAPGKCANSYIFIDIIDWSPYNLFIFFIPSTRPSYIEISALPLLIINILHVLK